MKPVNSKSLLAFVFGQMEKLDKKEIDVMEARAQAGLASQANNILKYELDRSRVIMELQEHNKMHSSQHELREVESIRFETNKHHEQ